jgi:hypothetical protein
VLKKKKVKNSEIHSALDKQTEGIKEEIREAKQEGVLMSSTQTTLSPLKSKDLTFPFLPIRLLALTFPKRGIEG